MRVDPALLAICVLLIGPASLAAEFKPALDELDEVLIVGTQPGPALWQVKSGANVLWVLATPPLVSKDLKWRSKQVEKVLAESQEVLAQYGTGHVTKSAIPAELRNEKGDLDYRKYSALLNQTRYLQEGQTLRDILPPDVYALTTEGISHVSCSRGIDRFARIATWLAAAERALAENASTLAVMEMTDLLSPGGQCIDTGSWSAFSCFFAPGKGSA